MGKRCNFIFSKAQKPSKPLFYFLLSPGELIIRQAPNVLKFDTFSGQKRGITGSLTCTNFKISFVSSNKPNQKTVSVLSLISGEGENKERLKSN